MIKYEGVLGLSSENNGHTPYDCKRRTDRIRKKKTSVSLSLSWRYEAIILQFMTDIEKIELNTNVNCDYIEC